MVIDISDPASGKREFLAALLEGADNNPFQLLDGGNERIFANRSFDLLPDPLYGVQIRRIHRQAYQHDAQLQGLCLH